MKEQEIEIFGMRVRIVKDDSEVCEGCALWGLNVCRPQACKDVNGNTSQKFIKVED